MEVVVATSMNASFSLHNSPTHSFSIPQVSQWKCFSVRAIDYRISFTHRRKRVIGFINRDSVNDFSLGVAPLISQTCFPKCSLFPSSWGFFVKRRKYKCHVKLKDCSVKFRQHASVLLVMLVMSVSLASSNPSWALTEENLLFLEAWRVIDRAYIDKGFNGQSWFRYREDALRNEPMNNREQTYTAIRKMLGTLGDPFTRFLEPEKLRSLRSGTQGALTGVGLSIGYPTKSDMPRGGLVVISASPGGPAYRAGVLSGDVILGIDDTTTENMGLYDAAERLQGPEGSSVSLTIRSGSDVKHLALTREKVSLNPVKSRLCKMPGSGNESPTIGYIKLTTFNKKASSAIKEAINTLRSNNVNAFVLDLRDNSGGLFPEGIEIAKFWLDKGVIVYICDSRGVRDILDTDGSSALATSEPLAVLVNKGTASASEILAGALKDNKRAIVFGEPTFGKGKIQSVFELSDGSGLVVTVARYETPAHTDIDKVGVIPDHPLPTSFPEDEDAFCKCLQDPASSCNVNRVQLFSKI
ncbi:PREDICTED: carboxyl-terminal-processing peptidase 2, chloroplastic isoform X2 [Lupinus angustifolius]|uniref:carboxyl-terminal-processing peptidase 2, chloroplastic isoform X1 n=1 Tax=Lupinus angustifolius TaxID=3871 RepID=UPI00092F7CE6|nr:PREDICTED: carboxyl-terminal-processing peptidase 2, chloroplastic isoform X1 [Lupinus angustifolius]XP_019441079.1 PREDICTED: carboxyl-terminal-processing peptidase 2, chloroplastic isoform X2 [Lupinus angustifolius]